MSSTGAASQVAAWWRSVEASEAPREREPARQQQRGGPPQALARAFSALMRLKGEEARAQLALLDGDGGDPLPPPWAPVRELLEIQLDGSQPSMDELAELAQRAERLARALGPGDPTRARALHIGAAFELRRAHAGRAEQLSAAALAALEPRAEHRRGWIAETLATAYARTGAWQEARRVYGAVLEAKQRLDDPIGVAITAGSWGRMELELGQTRQADAIAARGLDERLPGPTELRLRTLRLEAALERAEQDAGPEPSGALERRGRLERRGQEVAALAEALPAEHHLVGYAQLALARWRHRRGEDPAPALQRAAGAMKLPFARAYHAYWVRRLCPGPEPDEAWLHELRPLFEELGTCTLAEVLATLDVAERVALSDRARADRMLDALAERVAESNNPTWSRWIDEAGSRIDPRSAARRLLSRYLGSHADRCLDRTRRVDATVVFADLVGFTRRSVTLAPEEVMSTVRGLFELASAPLRSHRLHPLQYLGDGLLAIALGDDHGARALAFARALTTRIASVTAARVALGRGALPPAEHLHVRCGVASGPVVLGPLGNLLRTELLAIGMTTNRAARLQGYAEPDEIVCDELLVGSDAGERLEITPKGFESAILARRLRARREG